MPYISITHFFSLLYWLSNGNVLTSVIRPWMILRVCMMWIIVCSLY